ncbi:MAG TPA: sulfotransferase [Solirubrobacterales bacterium]|nr:sulfotransferase [Solirubrobacterales bacterium]
MKIFGIGLNKTGTSSLHAALELLGYRSLHFGGLEAHERVQQAIDEGVPLLRHLDPEPDAVTDVYMVNAYFFLADLQYPGSKFILTLRDMDDWLDSRRRHVERNQEMKKAGRYDGPFLTVDLESWAAEYRRHEAVVRAYFADRPGDLLAFRPADGDWGPLCAFLGRPVPEQSFPWENRDRQRVPSGEVAAG